MTWENNLTVRITGEVYAVPPSRPGTVCPTRETGVFEFSHKGPSGSGRPDRGLAEAFRDWCNQPTEYRGYTYPGRTLHGAIIEVTSLSSLVGKQWRGSDGGCPFGADDAEILEEAVRWAIRPPLVLTKVQ